MKALLKEIAEYPQAMVYALLVHVALAAVLFFSLDANPVKPPQPRVNIVQAVAVDEKQVQAELEKLKKAEELERKKAEAQRRKEELRKRRLEEKARELERKRKAEERRLAKLKKEREAEKRRKQELEKKRKAEEKRLAAKRAEEKKRLERLKAEQAALEKKRLAEEKRLREMEAKRKREAEAARRRAEEERKRREREAAMLAEIAAEQARLDAEKKRRLDSLRVQYIAAITDKVQRNWLKPPSAKPGTSCQVQVKQIPGGEVVDVTVTKCTGDEAFRRSVETAVRKASPLPTPKDPRLFERDLIFHFKPQ